jgi:opacity protein-like surface antigen
MMKKHLAIAMVLVFVMASAAVPVLAQELTAPNLTARGGDKSGAITLGYKTATTMEGRVSFSDEKQTEYEKWLDEQVKNGVVTREEADALKDNFRAMLDFCRETMNSGGRDSRGFGGGPGGGSNSGRTGCH